MPHRAALTSGISQAIAAFLVDVDGRVLAATTAADALLLAGAPRDALLREQLPQTIVEGAHLEASIARAQSSRAPVETPLVALRRGLEDQRLVRLRVVPYGEHVMVFVDDVHDLVCEERRRARINENEVFAAMAEVVSHQVGNPLAGFSAALQLTSASLAAGDARRVALERAHAEVKRIAAVCADLLAFADAGTPSCCSTDLRTVVETAIARAPAPAGATLVVEGDGRAFGDPELLARGVRHMLVNAWEAGARRVVVAIEPGRLRILDDGPGLPPEAMARAFDPFFTTKVSGTGLGLAIAARAVSAMGGSIAARASALGGAEFDVALPPVPGF